MGDLPHLTIEQLEDAAKVLKELRDPMDYHSERANAYRIVLTDVHQVIRNARDINNVE
jgi:hypothetical protein